MKKIHSGTKSETRELEVTLYNSGRFYARNSILRDTWVCETAGELRDLIADNSSLSLDEIRFIIDLFVDKKIKRISFNIPEEENWDDYDDMILGDD